MKKIYIFLSFCVFLVGSEIKFDGNLPELILAAQSSNLAQISNYEPQKAQLQKEAVKSAYMPSLTIDGGYSFLSGDINVLRPQRAATARVILELAVYDGGKREALLSSLSHLSAAEILKNEDYQNLLAFNATKLYFSFLSLGELATAKEGEINYLKNALNRLEKYYHAGLSDESEYEAINARYAMALAERLEITQNQNEIKNQIYALTGRDIKPVAGSRIAFLDDENSAPQKSTKPELEALRLNFAAALEDEKITASETNPQIFIKNTYTFMRTHYDRNLLPAQYRSALEPYFDDFFKPNLNTNELILGFSWKAFDFGANKKRREIKRISALQAKLNLDQKRLQNELNLANIKNDLKTLKQKIAAGESALNSAQTSLNAVSKKYEAGLLGYVEFLNATAQSFSAGSALELSKSKFEIKKAEYLYERGGKIAENIEKTERK
ncbi:TolC family protein [Campylobacter sp. Marseille-Q3452]|uniref:TolC family protein n=1 Tax=Campylobacter massiliensis TaxID=2762557 RepID=A0A842JDX0_9BACT|nr:TolC family protein [Campylobacter massiliensis]MBC2883244.1 TolC family protein [Campylobacter massiliensis]